MICLWNIACATLLILLLLDNKIFNNRWKLSFSSILNEIVKGSIEALHYCKTDVKNV